MTQQEFQLHILELDNTLNQRCEPIRKEMRRVEKLLDETHIVMDTLSLQLDQAKDQVCKIQMEAGAIRDTYRQMKNMRRVNGNLSQAEYDTDIRNLNAACYDELRPINERLRAANDEQAKKREEYGRAKLRLRELRMQFNTLRAEYKAIQREEWNRKHEFILAHPKSEMV